MIYNYILVAWRNLLRNKAYSFINIGGLALGMSVTLLIGLWIYDEITFNHYHDNYKTVARVYRNEIREGVVVTNGQQVTGLGVLLRSEYGAHFKNVAMIRARAEERVLASGENKFSQRGYFMQPEGADILSLRMKAGSRDGLRGMNTIFLSASLATKLFGSEDPLSQVVVMDANWNLKVTGVYEDLPRNSDFSEATYFAPLERYLDGWAKLDTWDNYHVNIYAQIHEGGDFKAISTIIRDATLAHVSAERAAMRPKLFLDPMSEWHMASKFENGVRVTSDQQRIVWFYSVIGVFVLLLACINFMNLSTARSERRAKEVGIRKSIGSQRKHLVQQFFGESLLVAFLSFIIAIIITRIALPAFNDIAGKDIAIPWNRPLLWIGGLAFTLLTGLLAGSYPALYLSSFNPIRVLKGTFKAGRFASVPRSVLVVIQFTISISLATGTAILYQQIMFAKERPVGYTREGLISMRTASPEYRGKYDALRNELKKTGVVEEIAEANYSVTSTLGWNGGFSWNSRKIEPSFNTIYVTHEYGKTVGLEFVDGRDFSRDFPTDVNGLLLNESAAKEMGMENPVGEVVTWSPGWQAEANYKILGVVKDMVKGSPFDKTFPSVIFLSTHTMEWLYIRIRPDVSAGVALSKMQPVFASVVPSAPFDYQFADDVYRAKFRAEESVGKLAGVLSALAIVISCLGLFGLSAFMAEQRTREISIRKVLGASVPALWRMLSSEFIVLTLVSCLLAVPIAWSFMSDWLDQFFYRLPLSWTIFAAAGAGAVLITLVTVSFQSVKAALTNPVRSLRSE